MKHDQPPYATRYPGLANILNEDPHAPRGNRITQNVMVGGRDFETQLKDLSLLTMENNWSGPDPGFVDRGMRDFRLERDSPARKTGYEDLPFEMMGMR